MVHPANRGLPHRPFACGVPAQEGQRTKRHVTTCAMDLQPDSMAYTSDGDDVQRSTTIDTYSKRVDRIELLLKEQVAGVTSDIYGLSKSMAEVSGPVDA
jgi:hypothetical protein